MSLNYFIYTCLLLVLLHSFLSGAEGNYRYRRDVGDYINTTVITSYGSLRGKTFSVSNTTDLDVFLGIPYAQPPIGDLRLARPEPIHPWSPSTLDATRHGAQCKGQILASDEVLEGVPYSEDCLFLDIYASRSKDSVDTHQPVMVYLHPGGYYAGTGAKYNYTNLALKGVVVVSVSFRLDALGYASTEDEVIPGNFGLLDAALALNFTKEIISNFGGNPNDVTLFGASSGAAMTSILMMSPLTKGTFHKAIIQSGPSLAPWAVYTPGRDVLKPRPQAVQLGRGLNCSLPETDDMSTSFSTALLACLRSADVDDLLAVSLDIQYITGLMSFIPVTHDAFGVLPDTPEQLLSRPEELPAIPTVWGYTRQDGSWLVPDPEDDGLTESEFNNYLQPLIYAYYPADEIQDMTARVYAAYDVQFTSMYNMIELRDIAIKIATDFSMAAYTVKQARLYARATGTAIPPAQASPAFMYEFNHRPSYSPFPLWWEVGHAEEKGLVLGLPAGPDAFSYPNTSEEDRLVAELVTDMWSNFAKTGEPTPQGEQWSGGVAWPEFGDTEDDRNLLVIQPALEVMEFDREAAVVAWTGTSGLTDEVSNPDPTPTTHVPVYDCSPSANMHVWLWCATLTVTYFLAKVGHL